MGRGAGAWGQSPLDEVPFPGPPAPAPRGQIAQRPRSQRSHTREPPHAGLESPASREPQCHPWVTDAGGPRTQTRPRSKPVLTSRWRREKQLHQKEVPGLNMAVGASASAQPSSAPPLWGLVSRVSSQPHTLLATPPKNPRPLSPPPFLRLPSPLPQRLGPLSLPGLLQYLVGA